MFKSLKGMPDHLPKQVSEWQEMELRLRRVFALHGFHEIRTPFIEETELFARSLGSATDVVAKEMYSFLDTSQTSLSLRPEGTASVLRAFLEHGLAHQSEIQKLFYMGPMFRHERPQKGRLRQFHQAGAEVIGSGDPIADIEAISLAMSLLTAFGVPSPRLMINSVGDPTCRKKYREVLQDHLRTYCAGLGEEIDKRIELNPMRLFDSKIKEVQSALKDAPVILEFLNDECRSHFEDVQAGLQVLEIPFEVNPRIVRGLDYYVKTAFEITAEGLGAQNAVSAGGRYDGLAKELGGQETPAVGFAMGLERLLLSAGQSSISKQRPTIHFLTTEENGRALLMKLANSSREAFLQTQFDCEISVSIEARSMKALLRKANKLGARWVVILGKDELEGKRVLVKDLDGGTQDDVSFDDLSKNLLSRCRT